MNLRTVRVWALLLALAIPARPYAVLSHEAVVDALWDTNIRPLLVARFGPLTDDQLRHCHAFAYGGSIMPDMGYYPLGSRLFTDLTHYVRTGEFVAALVADAADPNEFAFALGALTHYFADTDGHRVGTNRAVPLLYPRMHRRYGNVVTYADDQATHLLTEFAFDVLGVAKARFAPESYHSFIGFEVAAPLLNRAFRETYSLELGDVFEDPDLAIATFRRSVSQLVPRATRVAWASREKEIRQSQPGITRRRFLYNLSRASYEREWPADYMQPSRGERLLAFLFNLIPKIGPFRVFKLKVPSPDAERLFEASFNQALSDGRQAMVNTALRAPSVPDRNLDTGQTIRFGDYWIADRTVAELLRHLNEKHNRSVDPSLRTAIVGFYDSPYRSEYAAAEPKRWQWIEEQLKNLEAAPRPNVAPVAREQIDAR